MTEEHCVIGLTAPFGSGCSTAAQLLHDHGGFEVLGLSGPLREGWPTGFTPTRSDLQNKGNLLRKQSGDAGFLVADALKRAKIGDYLKKPIVIDGIKNVGEINRLKEVFGRRFFLFTLDCPTDQRWSRVGAKDYKKLGLTIKEFTADDQRDKDEEFQFGQQVQPCVDQADVLILNDDAVTTSNLRKKLLAHVALVTGSKPRYATPDEIYMNLAYSSSHGSKCLKRQVGAVLVAAKPGEMGEIVGVGFNENPVNTPPCVAGTGVRF